MERSRLTPMSERPDTEDRSILVLPRPERLPWIALWVGAAVAVLIATLGAWHVGDADAHVMQPAPSSSASSS